MRVIAVGFALLVLQLLHAFSYVSLLYIVKIELLDTAYSEHCGWSLPSCIANSLATYLCWFYCAIMSTWCDFVVCHRGQIVCVHYWRVQHSIFHTRGGLAPRLHWRQRLDSGFCPRKLLNNCSVKSVRFLWLAYCCSFHCRFLSSVIWLWLMCNLAAHSFWFVEQWLLWRVLFDKLRV